MASWKKVIVSGSQAELAGLTGSLLTDGRILGARDNGAIYSTGIEINGSGDLVANLTGSVNGNADTATTLETTRAIALSGDATGTANFNGSADISIAATLASGSVGHGQLENNAVSGSKIADGGVGYAKLADVVTDLTVAANVDADDTIASARSIKSYVDNQVGASTLRISGSAGAGDDIDLDSNDLEFTGSGVIEAIVTDNTVTFDVIDGTVTFDHLADGAASGSSIAADGVDGSHIVDDAIDSEHIAAGALDFEHFSAGSVSGSAIADAGVGNAKLVNDGLMIGNTDISLGATGSTIDGVTLTDAQGSGSFSGSFQGDGSNLTGIASTLILSQSAHNSVAAADDEVDLKNGALTVTGTTNEVNVTLTDDTLTFGLPDDVTITQDLTVGRNLIVQGDTTTLNTANLNIEDQFILLNSGSSGADVDTGIVFGGSNENAQSGSAIYFDAGDEKFGFSSEIAADAVAGTLSQYMGAIEVAAADPTDGTVGIQGAGTIHVNSTSEDIFIYV